LYLYDKIEASKVSFGDKMTFLLKKVKKYQENICKSSWVYTYLRAWNSIEQL